MIIRNIDQILNIITIASWILFVAFVLYLVISKSRQRGIGAGLRTLVSNSVLLLLVVVLVITVVSAAIEFIDPPEVGVVISVVSEEGVRSGALPSGLHLIIPLLEQVVRYPIYFQTYTMSRTPTEGQIVGDDSIRARTKDGQEVRLSCSVIFKINADQAVQVHIDWQNRYIEDFVRPVLRGIVRTQVSQYTVQEVNSSVRRDLEETLNTLLIAEFQEKGFELDQFLLRDIEFTPTYAQSIEDKQAAFEIQTQREYEAQQLRNLAQGEADAIRLRAEGQADALRLIGDALSENRDLITYYYVDKLSPNVRALLVPNNNPLILPLAPFLDNTETITGTSTQTETETSVLPQLPLDNGVTMTQ